MAPAAASLVRLLRAAGQSCRRGLRFVIDWPAGETTLKVELLEFATAPPARRTVRGGVEVVEQVRRHRCQKSAGGEALIFRAHERLNLDGQALGVADSVFRSGRAIA